jgi:hypothetical protein
MISLSIFIEHKRYKKHVTKKASQFVKPFAEWTGLEPATPCVTGMYSNQLNYHSVLGLQI